MHCLTVLFATAVLLVAVSHGKSIDRCDFVHELKRFRPQIEYNELNAWTCIAQYQSNFNTSLLNSDTTGAVYHGIFQISDVYWCSSTVNNDRACRIHCDQLHDTYLKDDFGCIEKVYAEHLRIHGNGFSAWPIHQQYCSDGRDLIKDCFAGKGIDKHLQQKDKFKSIAEKKAHKIYERCELARELYYKHNVPFEQVATWVCIAKYESNFNTSAVGHLNSDGSLDHGLFQISDIYWCSPPGKGWVCGLSCAKLENSDISDDVTCMMRIYNEHHRLSGNGFNAWSVYKPHCKHNVDQFIAGCFDIGASNEVILPMHQPGIFAPANIQKPAFKKKLSSGPKVFSRCELARELRYTHNIPKDQIHTWICIAQTLSGLNTAAEAPKNADGASSHGIFQISDQYWCSLNGAGNGCNIACKDLKDADLTNDIECVRKIFDEHTRYFGNGFQAWTPYENHCKYERPESIEDCFENEIESDFPSKPTVAPVTTAVSTGKVYERCELAKELRNVHNIPLNQIHTWVCIAEHESRFDTSAIGRLNADGSLDHGLFQISDIYWCSNSGIGKSCNAACSDFRNAHIADDVACVKKIHQEHEQLFGNGFHAWTVYEPHCRHKTSQYISDCFPNQIHVDKVPLHPTKPVVSAISNAVGDQGRAYERCELARELRYRHNVPRNQIADWVCIALYSSNLATSAKGPNSHGLFQINNEYWCSNNGVKGKQCNLECSSLEDSDITDDYQCARQIYETHEKLYGNGFSAWNVYEPYCHGRSSIIDGCFDDIASQFQYPAITTKNPNVIDGAAKKGKVYERCELARELRYKHNLPLDRIHTWVCIVQRESNFDTSVIGRLNADGSLDHGLFQISDIYWCSNSGVGKACGASCASFRDTNIADDVQCVRRIFDEHQRLFGNGFHAWTTYEPYCKQTTSHYTDDCFANGENVTKKPLPTFAPLTTTHKPIATTLTPLNQFKYSTFAPQFAPTQPTKYPTATAQFVSYYTTKNPLLQQYDTKSLTIPYKSFPFFGIQSTTPNSIAPIALKSMDYSFNGSTKLINLSTPAPTASSTKLNIFDLYLGRLTTKKPERYVIPNISPPKQQLSLANPYGFQTTRAPFALNAYSVADQYRPRLTTAKPSSKQVQSIFQSQVKKIARSLGISDATGFASVATTPRPFGWGYSFSGTKAPIAQ